MKSNKANLSVEDDKKATVLLYGKQGVEKTQTQKEISEKLSIDQNNCGY